MSISRNTPCPCGSTLRFKHCHGQHQPTTRIVNSTTHDAGQALFDQALRCYQVGNVPQAELIVRSLIAQLPRNPIYRVFLGDMALYLGLPQFAASFYEEALVLNPGYEMAQQGCLAASAQATSAPHNGPRYLLIKAWGYGFWSDVDHVLGALLAAEMTGRIPIVAWGSNSLFGNADAQNAWPVYFEPVSGYTLADVQHPQLTFYPAKWHAQNVAQEEVCKWAGSGTGSRQSALFFLLRPENVVVSDFYTGIIDLIPWLAKSSEYFGASRIDIYRRLAEKYLRPQAKKQQQTLSFWKQNMQGHTWLAVHLRGSDKVLEVENLEQTNRDYYAHVDSLLAMHPALKIFLITDSTPLLAQWRQRYGDRVLSTSCLRTDSSVGVHYGGHAGVQVGSEVLLDTLLAVRCDFFIGNGASNVSLAVEYLKDWPRGHYQLLGDDVRQRRNTFLHDW